MTQSQSPSTTILEQLGEKPKEQRYWWLHDPYSNSVGIMTDGIGVYIALYPNRSVALQVAEMDGNGLNVFPANTNTIYEKFAGLLNHKGAPFLGMAIMTGGGEVSEWRKWA